MSLHPIGARIAAIATLLPLAVVISACTATPAAEVATDTKSVTNQGNDRVPEGAEWTQHYFPSSDGSDVELHADVLLPEGLEDDEQVPVILSAGAYFGHSGQVGVEDWEHTGPSDRFHDFIEGTGLFERGYAFVMVDLRGFGGSSGCLDFMGPGERADIQAAIDWAASQPWSTGAVGMYGKSYDAISGLVGNNLDQDALKAVVAQEPIWDLYRNMWSNGVPRAPMISAANAYNAAAKLPQMPDDDPRYLENAAYEVEKPGCEIVNSLGYQTADPASEYWTLRDLATQAEGTDTPLFVTQGFLEWNTEPEAMEEFLTNHQGPQRGWLGQWDHKRGNDVTADGKLEMGRDTWFEETMSFYDEHLKGIEPSVDYPNYAVQDNTGSWRAQDTWPVVESSTTVELQDGSYLDDGAEGDPTADTGNSFFSWSEPITQATRITATPRVSFTAAGHGNVMIRLFDVAPDGTTLPFDEQVALVRPGPMTLDLKSTDWTLAPGHSLAVEIGTVKAIVFSDWIDSPSYETIQISDVLLELALDDPSDDIATDGDTAAYLTLYPDLFGSEMPVQPGTFTLPPARG